MLDYIFAVRSPILPSGIWIISLFLGLIIGYFTISTKKTLYRIPYLFSFALLYFVYVSLSWSITYFLIKTDLLLYFSIATTIILSVLTFLFGIFFMRLCVMRAYDGFGSKRAAWMIIIPFFNLGLFIVTLDDDENDPEPAIQRDPINTPNFMNGLKGVIIATFIAFTAFYIAMGLLMNLSNL